MNLIQPQAAAAPSDFAELIVAYLEQLGVEYVFGVPGGAIEPIYNALARSARRGGPRPITARHEAGAAFMADGYARESGRLGVCIATSGPGATNLLTGLACSYDNSVPVLAITGQPQLPSFGRRALQESGCTGINTLGMFRHCTRYNTLVSHPGQAETKLVSAIMRAHQVRGPAHLTIPVDLQRSPLPGSHKVPAYQVASLLAAPTLIDETALSVLHQTLSTAGSVVMLIGGGCGEAIDSVLAVAERLRAPFVVSPDAKGFVNTGHPLYRGVFGFAGHERAQSALEQGPELILAVGTSLGEWTSGGWSASLLNDRLIHIDASEDHLMRSPMARLHVRGRIASVFQRLLALLPPSKVTDLPAAAREAASPPQSVPQFTKPVHPRSLMRTLARRSPANTSFIADAGNSTAWAIHDLDLPDRRMARLRTGSERRSPHTSRLRVLMDFAPMGWAIGAAVGIAMARRGRPVVCLTGDGSYLMNGQEITVAQEEGLPVLFVVLNDNALGMVKHGQRLAGAESVGHALPQVNFAALASAMGIRGVVVRDEAELAALNLAALLNAEGPTLLDVRIDGEAVPPMGLRLRTLGTAQ